MVPCINKFALCRNYFHNSLVGRWSGSILHSRWEGIPAAAPTCCASSCRAVHSATNHLHPSPEKENRHTDAFVQYSGLLAIMYF